MSIDRPYYRSQNQNGVPRGQARYIVDCCPVEYKRLRKTVVCLPSRIDGIYRELVEEFRRQHQVDIEISRGRTFFQISDEFLKWYEALNRSKAQNEQARKSIELYREFFGDIPLNELRRTMIDDFIVWRRHQKIRGGGVVSDGTINHDIAILSRFFNFCIEREYYSGANPAFGKKLKERNHRTFILNKAQLLELLNKAEGQLYTAVILALGAGLRRGEILGLEWDEVDLERGEIRLDPQRTKSRKARTIPLSAFVREHLAHLRELDPFGKRVLNIRRDKFRCDWERLRSRLSFREIHGLQLRFHDLRRHFGQGLRTAGVNLGDISAFLGHSSVAITESRYAMYGGADGQEKVGKIDNVIPFREKKTS